MRLSPLYAAMFPAALLISNLSLADITVDDISVGTSLTVSNGQNLIDVEVTGSDATEIIVEEGGNIDNDGPSLDYAVELDGDLQQLTNNGTITATAPSENDIYGAVTMEGGFTLGTFTNSGSVEADLVTGYLDAISLEGTVTTFNNLSDGRLIGGDDSLRIYSGGAGTINNAGLIRGINDDGMQIDDSTVTRLINTGTIEGLGADPDEDSHGIELDNTLLQTLNNQGTILGNEDGIYAYDSTITQLNNSGTISASIDNAIELEDTSVNTLNISGTISGADDGLNLYNGTFQRIINSGNIIASSGDGFDIDSDSAMVIGLISNSGLIRAGDIGIEIGDGTTSISSLVNTGSIIGDDNGIYISSGATLTLLDNDQLIRSVDTDGIYLSDATITTLDNSGTIEGLGPSEDDTSGIYADNSTITTLINSSMNSIRGTDHGIYLDGGSTVGSITNTGLIYGGDEPDTGSDDTDTGITVTDGSTLTSLNNSGLISGVDGDADDDASNDGSGIIISAGGEITTLTNSGTIIGDDYSIAIAGGTLTTLNNSGILNGDLDLDSSSTTLNLMGDSSRVIGEITGSGATINVLGSFTTEGTVDVTSVNISGSGELTLNHSLTGDLTNSGILNISPGNIGTTAIDGNLTQNSGAELVIDYDQAMAPGNEGSGSELITVTGTATIDGTIRFSSTDMIDVASTSPIRIIDAASASFSGTIEGISGSFGELSGSGYAGSLGFVSYASTPNPVTVNAADTLALNTSALFLSASCGINGSADAAGRTSGVYRHSHSDCLTPSRNMLSFTDGSPAWGRLIFSQGRRGTEAGVSGYNFNNTGAVFGRDRQLDEQWSEGFSVGLIRSDATKDSWGKDQADSLYLGWQRNRIEEQRFYSFAVALGYTDFNLERRVAVDGNNLTAQGSPHAWTLAAKAAIGKELETDKDVYSRPTASLTWSTMRKSSYRETGAGDFGLTVNNETLQELRADAGVEVSFDQRADQHSDQIDSTLSISMGMSVRLAMDDRRYDARFNNFATPFTVQGDDQSRFLFKYGLGWTRHYSETGNLFVGLDGGYSNDYRENQLNIGFRKVW